MASKMIILACAVTLAAGAAFALDVTGEDPPKTAIHSDLGNKRPDGWITAKVKMSLWTTPGVRSTRLSVDTDDGAVTLYGKVASAEARNLAEHTASDILGVRSVRNLLVIVPPGSEKAVSKADSQVKGAVEQAFKKDPVLNESHIGVRSVDDGVVLLGGDSKNLAETLRAIQTADRVDGVKRVSSGIEGNDDFSFASRSFEQTGKKTDHSSLDDMRITSAAKLTLLTTSDVPSAKLNVDTNDGEVTLFGIVPNQAARTAASNAVRKINGVVGVNDELQVVPKGAEKRVESQDSDIDRALDAAFSDRTELKSVHHTTRNGVVRLTGNVDTGWDRLLAVRIARTTDGVKNVEQDLKMALVAAVNVR